jgi:hypothetical protein
MPERRLAKTSFLFVAVILLVISAAVALTKPAAGSSPPPVRPSRKKIPEIYEDSEIRVKIPLGWRIMPSADVKNPELTPALGNGARGPLTLEKDGFILALAYHTSQASGVIGGRFIEVFSIPWLDTDEAWTCSGSLEKDPWPASRQLLFVNLILDSGDEHVRERCGIQKDLGSWIEKNGKKEYDYGDRRWLGGYFTGEEGGFFFAGGDDKCAEKTYTLTTEAKVPEALPIANESSQNNNPLLEKMVGEAIDIVNSIDYKKCKPF